VYLPTLLANLAASASFAGETWAKRSFGNFKKFVRRPRLGVAGSGGTADGGAAPRLASTVSGDKL
jgi:hypothetical protein